MLRLLAVVALCMAMGPAHSHTSADVKPPERISIGSGFSVAPPEGPGWVSDGKAPMYGKKLPGEGHSLIFVAATGPSGITRDEIASIGEPDGASKLVKLVTAFNMRAWKAHASGSIDRFEKIDARTESGGEFDIGKLLCAYSLIRVRDHNRIIEGSPALLRVASYTCIEFPDMTVAATVSYSERGREQDLAESAMTEGEKFARSLLRQK